VVCISYFYLCKNLCSVADGTGSCKWNSRRIDKDGAASRTCRASDVCGRAEELLECGAFVLYQQERTLNI
jgi:hypothetical protein